MFIQHPQRLSLMLAHHCGLWRLRQRHFNMQCTRLTILLFANSALNVLHGVSNIDFYANFSYENHATSTFVDVIQNLYLLIANLIVFFSLRRES